MTEILELHRPAVRESLAGITLLRNIPAKERLSLEKKCTFRRFAAEQVILDRFSASLAVYFMIAGTARVVHHVADNQEVTIATVAGGDTIGEISAIDGLGRSATVVADRDCLIAELSGEEFRGLIQRRGDIALDLLRRWSVMIRQLSDKVSYLSTGSPRQRVYGELLRLARTEKPGVDRWLIRDLPSHQDLAKWAQTSREIVAGAVAEMVRRGVAERRTGVLYINDRGALKEMAARAEESDDRQE